MSHGIEWKVAAGRVFGTETQDRRRPIETQWSVPPISEERFALLAERFAADPLLAGRLHAGRLSGNDCDRVGMTESDWTSACSCGAVQPCSHARTLLRRYRERAKTNPSLWFAAQGADMAKLGRTVREIRAETVRAAASKERSALIERIRTRLREQDSGRPETFSGSPLLPHMSDPAFWKRDVSLAEWLAPLYAAAGGRRSEEEE